MSRLDNLLPANRDAIDGYMEHIKTNYAELTRKNHLDLLIMFAKGVKKDFKAVTGEDIDKYLATLKPSTAEIMKSKLRKFYSWFYKTKKPNLPDVVSGLEGNPSALKPKHTTADVLSPEEIEKMITVLPFLGHKALLETFFVTGGRIEEIRNLDVNDIEEKDGIIWINFRVSKTVPRKIPVCPIEGNPTARYPIYLMKWHNQQKRRGETPLFISLSYCNYGNRLSNAGLRRIIYRAGKLGIKKHIYPHLLRHTGASYDGSFLTEQDLCIKYGWKISSVMARTYCHTSEKQLGATLKRLAGVTDADH